MLLLVAFFVALWIMYIVEKKKRQVLTQGTKEKKALKQKYTFRAGLTSLVCSQDLISWKKSIIKTITIFFFFRQ